MTAAPGAATGAARQGAVAPRLLIVELHHVGHPLYHTRLLAEAALERGWTPIVAVPRAVRESVEYGLHLAAIEDRLQLETIPGDEYSIRELARIAARTRATRVAVPDGDRLCMRLGRSWRPADRWPLPRVPLALLVMRDRGQAGGLPGGTLLKTAVKRVLMLSAAVRPGVRIAVLRPTTWRGRSLFRAAIDPLTIQASDDDRARARAELAATGGADARWVGVFGALTIRKNIRAIAEGVLASGDRRLGLVALGHFEDDARADAAPAIDALRAAGHPVLVEDRWLTDEQLDAFVGVVDCLALVYSNEGPSGLFGKALASGTYVLAGGARMLREEARRNPRRASWTPIDPAAMAAVLRRLPPRAPADPGIADERSFVEALIGPPR